MNKVLKFSWAHIFAFLALIFATYVIFMGFCYFNLPYWIAIAGTALVDVVLILFSILPQQLKGTSEDFLRCVKWERFLVFASPVIFLVFLVPPFAPFSHFWSVLSKNHSVEQQFECAMEGIPALFDKYDKYADERIGKMGHNMVIIDQSTDYYRTDNRQKILKQQLKSANYVELKSRATEWGCMAKEGNHSVWNIFLIGNVNKIEETVTQWHSFLVGWSNKKFSFEEPSTEGFDKTGDCIRPIQDNLSALRKIYYSPDDSLWKAGFSLWTLLAFAIFYLLMYLPYYVQRRDGKAPRNIGLISNGDVTSEFVEASRKRKSKQKFSTKNASTPHQASTRVMDEDDIIIWK